MDTGDRKLKNYKKYKRKLLRFINLCEIKLVYSDNDSLGWWSPSRRIINIRKNLTQSEEIATLLHEIGHSLDECILNYLKSAQCDKAYARVYKEKFSATDKRIVTQCERRAWLYGVAIAKRLNIKIGIWYELNMQDGLDWYKSLRPNRKVK